MHLSATMPLKDRRKPLYLCVQYRGKVWLTVISCKHDRIYYIDLPIEWDLITEPLNVLTIVAIKLPPRLLCWNRPNATELFLIIDSFLALKERGFLKALPSGRSPSSLFTLFLPFGDYILAGWKSITCVISPALPNKSAVEKQIYITSCFHLYFGLTPVCMPMAPASGQLL